MTQQPIPKFTAWIPNASTHESNPDRQIRHCLKHWAHMLPSIHGQHVVKQRLPCLGVDKSSNDAQAFRFGWSIAYMPAFRAIRNIRSHGLFLVMCLHSQLRA